MSLLALLFSAVSVAADVTPIIYAKASASQAIGLAAERLELLPMLDTVSFEELVAGRAPFKAGAGTMTGCAGDPVSPKAFKKRFAEAEMLLAGGDDAAAGAKLKELEAALPCLTGPVDENVPARIPFLEAVVAQQARDARGLESALRRVHSRQPGYVDSLWAVKESDRYRDIVAAGATGSLRILPTPAAASLRVDGRLVDAPPDAMRLPPGPHLVQLEGGGTWMIDLIANGTTTVVVPAALRPPTESWVGDTVQSDALTAVLAEIYGFQAEAFVVVGERIWRGRAGTREWHRMLLPGEEVEGGSAVRVRTDTRVDKPVDDATTPEDVVLAPRPERDGFSPTWLLVGPGVGVAVPAAIVATLSYGRARTAIAAAGAPAITLAGDRPGGPDHAAAAAWAEHEQAWRSARTSMWVANGVAAGGLALAGVGMLVQDGGRVRVAPRLDAPGVWITVR